MLNILSTKRSTPPGASTTLVIIVCLALGLSSELNPTAQAATLTVCDSGCDFTSIQVAVDNADNDDTLDIQSTITEQGIVIDRPLTIRSSTTPPQIVQANALPETATDRVFFISSLGTVFLENLIIRHGVAPGAAFGGGVYTNTSTVLTDVRIENNSAIVGGGLATQFPMSTIVQRSSFIGNKVTDSGGAIYCDSGLIEISDTTMAQNTAFEGGGVYAGFACTPTIVNSTLSQNRAANGGGGIFNRGNTTVNDSTFARNSLRAIQSNGGTFFISNSILAQSLTTPYEEGGSDCAVFSGATITDGGHNLVEVPGSCNGFFNATGTETGVDSELKPLGDYNGPTLTHDFPGTSPAFNTGSANGLTDQRGFPRGIFGSDDKGALERQTGEFVFPREFLAQAIRDGVSHNVRFERFSSRGGNFEVQIQQSGGSFSSFSPNPFHHQTYIGRVQGLPGAMAAAMYFPLSGELVYNVIFEDGKEWNNVDGVTTERTAVLPASWPQWTARDGGSGSNVWGAEVGVDVPFDDFTGKHNSDPNSVVAWTEYSVLRANLLFMHQAGVRHQLGRIVIRADLAADPYDGITTHDDSLAAMENEWENALEQAFPNGTHDIALVTHATDSAGLASVGSITSPGYSSNASTNRGDFSGVWRHEAGHNWGLNHFMSDATPGGTIMGGNRGFFWGPSQETMLAYRDNVESELDDLGALDADLPPRASEDVVFFIASDGTMLIDVLANDHDANGDALELIEIGSASGQSLGGTMVLAPGEGTNGQNVVRYTPPAIPTATSAIDRFTYRIRDASGQEAVGYVFVRLVNFDFLPASTFLQNFDAFADGVSIIGDGSYLSSTTREPSHINPATLSQSLRLMPEQGGRQTSYTLPLRDLEGGFVVQFSYNVSSTGQAADNFVLNFGDPSPRTGPGFATNGGFRNGLTLVFDTFGANRGYNIVVDGTIIQNVPNTTISNGVTQSAIVSWNPFNGLSLTVDGTEIFDKVDLSNEFTPTSEDLLAFGSRTGGFQQQVLLDSIIVSPALITPANDDFEDAIDISNSPVEIGTLVNATPDGQSTVNTPMFDDVWYTYTAQADGNFALNTCGSNVDFGTDTVISVHEDDGGSGTVSNQLIVNDDVGNGNDPLTCGPDSTSLDSALILPVTENTSYLIRVGYFFAPAGEFNINWSFEPAAVDTDGDGIDDSVDNCTLESNPSQYDSNGDGIGNRCDADINNDCLINFSDYVPYTNAFGSVDGGASFDPDLDADGNGVINFLDIVEFQQNFLGTPGPSASGCDASP